jgi:hypothetical protein
MHSASAQTEKGKQDCHICILLTMCDSGTDNNGGGHHKRGQHGHEATQARANMDEHDSDNG